MLKACKWHQGWGQRLATSAEWQPAISHTCLFFSVYYAFGFYLAVAFNLHNLLPFYSTAPKNWKWKASSHIFSAHTKKKKKQQKKSSGLSLTFGNPDILCTKVSDIKADCFHAYISNIICFTSAYAQASWIPTVLLPVNVHSVHTNNGLSEPACLSTFLKRSFIGLLDGYGIRI